MSTGEPQKPKIIVDEDWKTRVQAEREAAPHPANPDPAKPDPAETDRAKTDPAPEKRPDPESTAGGAGQIPEASFSVLATTLAPQTLVALGQAPLPGEEKTTVNLPFAKHCIDTLDMLEQKTKGNLTPHEAQLLSQFLYQLRMLYVSVKNQQPS